MEEPKGRKSVSLLFDLTHHEPLSMSNRATASSGNLQFPDHHLFNLLEKSIYIGSTYFQRCKQTPGARTLEHIVD